MELDELFDYYGTDKGEYAPIYQALFKNLREHRINILEVGIGTMLPGAPKSMIGYAGPSYTPGGSLRAWRDYFSLAEVYGIDLQTDTLIEDQARIHTAICDSTSAEAVAAFIAGVGDISFDVVIDDGSHEDRDQLATLRNLYPSVNAGGSYIIEDVWQGGRNGLLTEFRAEVDAIKGNDYLFVTEHRNFVVISRRTA